MSFWNESYYSFYDYNYSYNYEEFDYNLGPASVVVPTLWAIFSVFGLVGNVFIIFMVFKYSHMRTVTNYYIVNLALTDIALLLICVPMTSSVYAFHTKWMFGDTMCRIVAWMQFASWQATCLTLTVISVDRYHAIVHPIKSIKYRTPRAAIVVNVSIWLYSYLVTTPTLYFYRQEVYSFDPDHPFCLEFYESNATFSVNNIFALIYTLQAYLIPLVIVFVCYALMLKRLWRTSGPSEDAVMSEQASRQKRKITRMVFVVVMLYTLCHLPHHVFNILFRFNYDMFSGKNDLLKYLRMVTASFLHFNSVINPVVYNVLGDNFKKSLKKAFFHHFRNNKVRDSNTVQTVNGNGTRTMNVSNSNRVHPSISQSRSENPVETRKFSDL
ncbi:G-protein coupled receptor 54-like [Ptychodera flava]|uniref:G-protein coupled receptor 54-like n=1 Tax=Ptychodera flava TaxID=63121 RepID=UPI00396A5EBC